MMNFLTRRKSKKIKHRKAGLHSTPAERLQDIFRRSDHYASECKTIAAKNMQMDQRLTITSFSLSLGITTALLLFQSGIIDNKSVIWLTIAGSSLVSLISIFQKFSFDPTMSAKLLSVSTNFNEIKDKADQAEYLLSKKKINDGDALDEHRNLAKQYDLLKNKYISYSRTEGSYYGFGVGSGPGKINIDIDD